MDVGKERHGMSIPSTLSESESESRDINWVQRMPNASHVASEEVTHSQRNIQQKESNTKELTTGIECRAKEPPAGAGVRKPGLFLAGAITDLRLSIIDQCCLLLLTVKLCLLTLPMMSRGNLQIYTLLLWHANGLSSGDLGVK